MLCTLIFVNLNLLEIELNNTIVSLFESIIIYNFNFFWLLRYWSFRAKKILQLRIVWMLIPTYRFLYVWFKILRIDGFVGIYSCNLMIVLSVTLELRSLQCWIAWIYVELGATIENCFVFLLYKIECQNVVAITALVILPMELD